MAMEVIDMLSEMEKSVLSKESSLLTTKGEITKVDHEIESFEKELLTMCRREEEIKNSIEGSHNRQQQQQETISRLRSTVQRAEEERTTWKKDIEAKCNTIEKVKIRYEKLLNDFENRAAARGNVIVTNTKKRELERKLSLLVSERDEKQRQLNKHEDKMENAMETSRENSDEAEHVVTHLREKLCSYVTQAEECRSWITEDVPRNMATFEKFISDHGIKDIAGDEWIELWTAKLNDLQKLVRESEGTVGEAVLRICQ